MLSPQHFRRTRQRMNDANGMMGHRVQNCFVLSMNNVISLVSRCHRCFVFSDISCSIEVMCCKSAIRSCFWGGLRAKCQPQVSMLID